MSLCGCDVGTGAVKLAVVAENSGEFLFMHRENIRNRAPETVVERCFQAAARAGFNQEDFHYIAATGDVAAVPKRTGTFYAMTCHARGARQFAPDVMSVLDIGALHMRAMVLDARGKILSYKMTSQCASGMGRFLENVGRYLGLDFEEMQALSLASADPSPLSTVCAVLAETDIINQVSRGVPVSDIVRGIHNAMAQRAVKLLSVSDVRSPLAVTGGLGVDKGFVRALSQELSASGFDLELRTHEFSPFAGALGAAIWGGVRLKK